MTYILAILFTLYVFSMSSFMDDIFCIFEDLTDAYPEFSSRSTAVMSGLYLQTKPWLTSFTHLSSCPISAASKVHKDNKEQKYSRCLDISPNCKLC